MKKTVFCLICLLALSPFAALSQQPATASKMQPGPNEVIEDWVHYAKIDKNGKCALHHEMLWEQIVPLYYGLEFPLVTGQAKYFPNARDHANGGCVFPAESHNWARVLQCSTCFAAKEKRYQKFLQWVKERRAKEQHVQQLLQRSGVTRNR